MTSLKIASINVSSFGCRKRRTEVVASLEKEGVDLCLIQETRIKNKFVNSNELGSYNCFREDAGVGTLILCKYNFKTERVKLNTSEAQTTAIKIKLRNKEPLTVVSAYFPVASTVTNLDSDMTALLEQLGHNNVVLGGDLNTGNQSTKMFFRNWKYNNSQLFSMCSPRGSTFRTGSTLDHFIISTDLKIKKMCYTKDIGLEHRMIITEIFVDSKIENDILRKVNKWKLTNWDQFRDGLLLENRSKCPNDRNLSPEEIDKVVEEFTDDLQVAICNHVPKGLSGRKVPLDLPQEIHMYYRERRRLKQVLRKAKGRWLADVDRIEHLKRAIRDANNAIDKIVNTTVNSNLEYRLNKFVNGNKNNNRFKEIRKMQGKNTALRKILLTDSAGTKIFKTVTKIEEFKAFYSQLYDKIVPPCPLLDVVTQSVASLQNTSYIVNFDRSSVTSLNVGNKNTRFTTLKEVAVTIKGIKPKTSAGEDIIPNIVLKQLPISTLVTLTSLYNQCINSCYFPKMWKTALIIPIPKKAGYSSSKDFRPISLTSNLGKILESILLSRLNPAVEAVVPKHQFGFRRGHSTVNALTILNENIHRDVSNGKFAAIISLDIKKAFDSVWHDGLTFRIMKATEDAHLTKILDSFLRQRTGRIAVEGERSAAFTINRGVPQGSRLGPILYNLYSASVGRKLKVDYKDDLILQFADDTLVKSNSGNAGFAMFKAGRMFAEIKKDLEHWGIEVNAGKTQSMICRPKGKRRGRTKRFGNGTLTLGEVSIRPSKHLKYLGVTFSKNLSFDKHTREMCKKGKRAIGASRRLLESIIVKHEIKKLIYRTMIRPCATYAASVWATERKQVDRLLRMERWAFRYALNMNRRENKKFFRNEDVYEAMNMERIDEFISVCSNREEERRYAHSNELYNEGIS